MKQLVNKFKPASWQTFALGLIAILATVAPESAFAAAEVRNIVSDSIFRDAITLGFGLFAFVQWIDYVANFSTGSALPRMIVPALATFLTFKWTMVLGWFKLV